MANIHYGIIRNLYYMRKTYAYINSMNIITFRRLFQKKFTWVSYSTLVARIINSIVLNNI